MKYTTETVVWLGSVAEWSNALRLGHSVSTPMRRISARGFESGSVPQGFSKYVCSLPTLLTAKGGSLRALRLPPPERSWLAIRSVPTDRTSAPLQGFVRLS